MENKNFSLAIHDPVRSIAEVMLAHGRFIVPEQTASSKLTRNSLIG